MLLASIYLKKGPGPFGLTLNQRRTKNEDRLLPHAFWYNEKGYYLGEGDIGTQDMAAMIRLMPDREAMIILPVINVGVNFVKYDHEGWPPFIHTPGEFRLLVDPEQLLSMTNPWLIMKNKPYLVLPDWTAVSKHRRSLKQVGLLEQFQFEAIPVEDALELIKRLKPQFEEK